MSRLFWKLFFAIWLAMGLLIGSLTWVNARIMSQIGLNHPEDVDQIVTNRLAMMQAAIERRGGVSRSIARYQRMGPQSREGRMVFILDARGREIHDRPLPALIRRNLTRLPDQSSEISMIGPGVYHAASLDRNGELLHLMAVSPRAPSLLSLSRTGILLRLLLALLISAVVSFVLARSLTRPLERIRRTANALAGGDLDARVGSLGNRHDELTDLAADFDHMAGELKSALVRQQRLLRDVSHELRSPLTRIQVASELARQRLEPLLHRNGEPDSLRELDRIESDVRRLDQLIGDALQLARHERNPHIGSDHPGDTPQLDCNLSDLITRIIERARIESEPRGITLDPKLQTDVTVCARVDMLDTAIENILRNAIAYSPNHSSIDIRLETSTEAVQISVDDRGPGVPESQLSLIFDPFFRVSEAREHHSGGTGLGLSIAQRAITAQDGSISACNRPGGGLSVRIQLPR